MEVFGLSGGQLQSAGAEWTAREVLQQPVIWREVEVLMAAQAAALSSFLSPLLARRELRIVLSGAGTSAYAGECLALCLARQGERRVDAIATTDIVASPHSWLAPGTPTLLVSFARSGNSPESLAALELAERCVAECFHLVITCNAAGALYQRVRGAANAYAIVLPEASNDRGFAMTSSFSGMLLAAALALGAVRTDGACVQRLQRLAQLVLPGRAPLLRALAAEGFGRAVFLGSNELKGLAREAALKMLELTDGRVVASADAPLGFRHGPKTVVDHGTLIVAFVSGDPYTRRYDLDLLQELRRDAVAKRVVALSTCAAGLGHADDVVLGDGAAPLSDLEACFPYALFSQSLALLKSLALGVRPDTPNAAGTVSRVVQGVSIYPWSAG